MTNVGIVGDRNFRDEDYIRCTLDEIFFSYPNAQIVTGDCPTGVDEIVTRLCVERGHEPVIERVDRSEYIGKGNTIYFNRNLRVVRQCEFIHIIVCMPYRGRGSSLVRLICFHERVPYCWHEIP